MFTIFDNSISALCVPCAHKKSTQKCIFTYHRQQLRRRIHIFSSIRRLFDIVLKFECQNSPIKTLKRKKYAKWIGFVVFKKWKENSVRENRLRFAKKNIFAMFTIDFSALYKLNFWHSNALRCEWSTSLCSHCDKQTAKQRFHLCQPVFALFSLSTSFATYTRYYNGCM